MPKFCDKVCQRQTTGRLSSNTTIFSTDKTYSHHSDGHDIIDILLKVTLNPNNTNTIVVNLTRLKKSNPWWTRWHRVLEWGTEIPVANTLIVL
jgi:hypothetical protein